MSESFRSAATFKPDAIVIGGGASGLMCAISAGYRGKRVLVLEKNAKVGLKILVSGGGRCNFTNLYADPREQYLSDNAHFCISAMRRYPPSRFIDWVEAAGIAYHEKKLGQLFCDHSAKDIVTMLLAHCETAGVSIQTAASVNRIEVRDGGDFLVQTDSESYLSPKVVIASGGLPMPKIASDLALRTARSLCKAVVAPRAALVPLTWNSRDRETYAALSGISTEVKAHCGEASFRENLLFTHRGLSGPAILQVSSFWREGDTVSIDLLPDANASDWLCEARAQTPRQQLSTALRQALPRRLVDLMMEHWVTDQRLAELSTATLRDLGERINSWAFKPGGSEGYRTAEVMLGGIDTREVSSKTFEVNRVPGLYVVGEALDVTGWLGGYNFQWAWASGWCCGEAL